MFLFPHSVLSLFFLKAHNSCGAKEFFSVDTEADVQVKPDLVTCSSCRHWAFWALRSWKIPAESTRAPPVTSRVSEGPTEAKTLTLEISGETTQDKLQELLR